MTTGILSSSRAAPSSHSGAEATASSSYGEILQSSALIGLASVIGLVIGLARTKAMAVLLGPAGVGLLGLYSTTADLVRSLAGLGINASGVRQIAAAVGTGDTSRIALTVTVLRRTAVVLGVVGAAALAVFSRQVAVLTFGDDQHAPALALLSLAVLFRLVADAQGALVQGMRRINDLARMSVFGALIGTIVSIAIVYWLRTDGIVPSLVALAAISVLTSHRYSRKVSVKRPSIRAPDVRRELGGLFKLGIAFMASGFLTLAAAYTVRLIVLRNVGLEATGLYESAWTLGGLYVGIVLQAMGADFYPRLVSAAADDRECNRLVNEQAQVSMLLSGPGVLATLTLAPFIVEIFYSKHFDGSVTVLRWICLGMALRIITWPMGYIVVAKGRQIAFFLCEIAWAIVNIGLTWLCVGQMGVEGAGVAFFGSYVFHALIIYPTVRAVGGFRWSVANRKTGALFLGSIGATFCFYYAAPLPLALAASALVTGGSCIYSIRLLLLLVEHDAIPRRARRVLAWFGLSASGRA